MSENHRNDGDGATPGATITSGGYIRRMLSDSFPALAEAVIARGMLRLEGSGSPDPDAAQELLHLAHRLELDTGRPSPAVPWLVRYLGDCAAVGVC